MVFAPSSRKIYQTLLNIANPYFNRILHCYMLHIDQTPSGVCETETVRQQRHWPEIRHEGCEIREIRQFHIPHISGRDVKQAGWGDFPSFFRDFLARKDVKPLLSDIFTSFSTLPDPKKGWENPFLRHFPIPRIFRRDGKAGKLTCFTSFWPWPRRLTGRRRMWKTQNRAGSHPSLQAGYGVTCNRLPDSGWHFLRIMLTNRQFACLIVTSEIIRRIIIYRRKKLWKRL